MGTLTGNLIYQANSIDAKQANNGVSSTQYPTTFNITDKNGYTLTRQEAIIESGGNIKGYWYVRNYNTSGTQVGQKGITITMNKSGTLTYGFDDNANARSALGGICARPDYSISTTDLTAGTSALTTNALYFVYA